MLRLSNSKTECFMHSERCFWWRYIRKLYPKASSPALTWGSAVHSALEHFFELGTVNGAMFAMGDSGEINDLVRMEREGSHLTPERLRMVLDGYAKEYKKDLDKWDIIAIEDDARVNINDDIVWQAIRDLIVRIDGLTYIIDHKTTGKKVASDYYSASFDTSQQMTSYHWMGQEQYGDDFGGIIINAIQSTKTIPFTFARFPIIRDDWQVEHFINNITAIAPRIEDCEHLGAELLAEGASEEDPLTLAAFPMRWTYGENFCDYNHLNNCMPEMRPAMIEQLYKEGK